MKFYISILLMSILMFGSCKSKAQTSKTNTATTTCKVVFNFGSRGDGINQKKHDELTGLLNTHKVKYTEKVAGREGEKEICIPLTELKDKEKTEFIEQLKTFEDKNTFISLSIN